MKSKQKFLSRDDIINLPKYHRINLINTLSGPRSANLIGTQDSNNIANLAIFNSVTHIGANPPYLGVIMRPLTVVRDTYNNIKALGHYTINSVNEKIYKQAHLTSGKYPSHISEFVEVGLTPAYVDGFPAPYVKECNYSIGLSYQEEHLIACNNTILLIGSIEWVTIQEHGLTSDLCVDYDILQSIAVGGLDTYYKTRKVERLSYAKV